MQQQYPGIKPYSTEHLKVDNKHSIYLEQSGNPDGVPVLVVHGGPGAGSHAKQRCWFDPNHYRIILFDQRGCGQSTPHGELHKNTTQELIADMEKIREHLFIESWILFGGSWGSTLSLLYAQAYPERVSHMILRSILLANKQNREWFFQHGANLFFPDYWREFVKDIPANERDDIVNAFHQRLNSNNELMRMSAAKAWSLWHRSCATINPGSDNINSHATLRLARIESHYFNNACFIEENQILKNMKIIQHIPTIIIHGRYDIICPLDNAYQVHKQLRNSRLEIIRDAGHASSEPAIADALVKATNSLAENLTIS
jgi:proline iminopeptidase